MRVLIIGGNGFIGSHLVDAFSMRGDPVRVLDRQNELFRDERPGVDYVYADFEDLAALEESVKGTDLVVHLASTTIPQTSNANPAFDVQTNLVGSIGLLSACNRQGINRVVFISSGGVVYGIPRRIPIPEDHPTDPLCSYGINKLAIEKYLALYERLYGLRYTVLRCANPYGERQNPDSRQGAVPVFLMHALRGEEIEIWGDGEVVRDYFYISDLVEAFMAAAGLTGECGIYNIGSGVGTSLNRLLDVIRKVTGLELKVRYTPSRKLDVPVNILDCSRARRELGWSACVPLEEGIARTWEWIKKLDAIR
jgi:UDP-glucose 4-epimerase